MEVLTPREFFARVTGALGWLVGVLGYGRLYVCMYVCFGRCVRRYVCVCCVYVVERSGGAVAR